MNNPVVPGAILAQDQGQSSTLPANAFSGMPAGARRLAWLDSIWFQLALGLAIGVLTTLAVLGPASLNPRNLNWLTPDPAYHFISWELFRQDPHLHWPLTYTQRIGYPQGQAVALTDLNPLLALILKPLSPVLPEPFQYFGFEVVLACALQFLFAMRLLRLLIGSYFWPMLLSSLFFVIAPPLTYRIVGHYSLTNQWLLVASLWIFFRAQRKSDGDTRSLECSSIVLAAIAVAINPYLAFEVLFVLGAAIVSLLWQHRLSLTKAIGVVAAIGITGVVIAYSFGFIIPGGKGYTNSGYRYYSLNLLAPFDPFHFKSILFYTLPQATRGQNEGYNYLGAGIILLTAVVVLLTILRRDKLRKFDRHWAWPLFVSCLLLTVLALSTKITFGSATVLDLDPHEKLSPFFASLRATGRLFWLPYYTILTAVLAGPYFLLRRRWATLLVACALAIQFADTASLRHWVHSEVNVVRPQPLKSPVWTELGSEFQNLLVLPPWQCDDIASPGGPDGYRAFGYLAVAQKMRTNSFNSARYNETARDQICTNWASDITEHPLAVDSAYVVSPIVARMIAEGPTGPGKCHDLDGFILCAANRDLGLSPTLMHPAIPVTGAIRDPGFEDNSLSSWSPYLAVKSSLATAQARSGSHSLAEGVAAGSVYQDVSGLQPGSTYTVTAWISASAGASASAQLALFAFGAEAPKFSAALTPRPGWQLLSESVKVGQAGSIRIHLFRNQGSGTLYWDDIQLYQMR